MGRLGPWPAHCGQRGSLWLCTCTSVEEQVVVSLVMVFERGQEAEVAPIYLLLGNIRPPWLISFCRTTVCLFTTFPDWLFLFLLLFLHVLKSFSFFADKV